MMMSASLRFEQGSCTDAGCVRPINEDAYVARGQDGLWAVADGMGGHDKGYWASACIAEALGAVDLPTDLGLAAETVECALAAANARICQAGAQEGRIIGSTAAILLVRDRRYIVFWVGDSRVYHLRGDAFLLLTTDHSPVEQMVASGLLTREEADDHPMAHMLSRAVGAQGDLTIDRCAGEIRPGDRFLLCSDGLTRTIEEQEIHALVVHDTPERAAAALIDLALERGAKDNVTVVVVGCDETTLISRR